MNAIRYIPFTYPWILDRAIGNNIATILDIGCGNGELMKKLSIGKEWDITGVDIYKPTIKEAEKTKAYKNLYVSNIVKLPKSIKKNKYDLVFSSQVIEHLSKKDARLLIAQMEKLAVKRIVVTTTVGFMRFSPLEQVHHHKHDDNPYQEHRSSWDPKEFIKKGYTSRGQGLYLIYREGYLAHSLHHIFHPILFMISLLFSPIVYFRPSIGTYQINWKNSKRK